MPGTTPNRGYPFPELDEDPNGPEQVEALAQALDVDVEAIATDAGTFVGFLAYAAAAQMPAADAWTKVACNTQVFDSDGWYDPATARFTPLLAGWYRVAAVIYGNEGLNSGEFANLAIYKNGGTAVYRIAQKQLVAGMTLVGVLGGETIVELDGVDDYVECFYMQSDSVARQINGGGGNGLEFNRFFAQYLGA